MLDKQINRQKRKLSIRKKISGTPEMPRAAVYRSNKYLYCQLIDDVNKVSFLGMSDKTIKSGTKSEKANLLGKKIAELAVEKNITKIVFDRAGYKYHGRVASFAEGLREGGLIF
jgi:large subunit ribosomal protein L18